MPLPFDCLAPLNNLMYQSNQLFMHPLSHLISRHRSMNLASHSFILLSVHPSSNPSCLPSIQSTSLRSVILDLHQSCYLFTHPTIHLSQPAINHPAGHPQIQPVLYPAVHRRSRHPSVSIPILPTSIHLAIHTSHQASMQPSIVDLAISPVNEAYLHLATSSAIHPSSYPYIQPVSLRSSNYSSHPSLQPFIQLVV